MADFVFFFCPDLALLFSRTLTSGTLCRGRRTKRRPPAQNAAQAWRGGAPGADEFTFCSPTQSRSTSRVVTWRFTLGGSNQVGRVRSRIPQSPATTSIFGLAALQQNGLRHFAFSPTAIVLATIGVHPSRVFEPTEGLPANCRIAFGFKI